MFDNFNNRPHSPSQACYLYYQTKFKSVHRYHTMKYSIKTCSGLFILIFIAVIALPDSSAANVGTNSEYNWGISRKAIIDAYISPREYTEFRHSERPDYQNKIMNYIIAINSALSDKITIIRSKSDPEKDFLLVNNKLCSVLEDYNRLSHSSLASIISNLSGRYKQPSIQKDRDLTIYSFFDNRTKIIVIAQDKDRLVSCKVYYYSSKLFRMLLSE